MQTKQAIQTSANVIRITTVSAGDVYKRFDENGDYVFYGIVKAVHNDGENTIIESVEYRYGYSSLNVEYKVIRGTKDYVIFPSTPEEFNLELDKAREACAKKISDAKSTIDKETRLIAEIDGLISGETQKSLKGMSYRELTQSQYEEKKAALLS